MAPLPVLYSFRRCPYAIRARLALQASGVQVQLREVVLRDKPKEMMAISPKGTVPVLQLADGRVIEQSLEIMRWALALHDPQHWLTHEGSLASAALIERNDGLFKQLLDRYKYPERHPEQAQAEYRDEALTTVLMPLEHLLQTHANLLGTQPALADMAVLPFVRQFAQVDADWFAQAPLPKLQTWMTTHLNSALFKAVMTKVPTWQSGASPERL